MYLQQIAGLLYEPLAYLYHQLMGRTGIYLFGRHLFFFLSLFVSWIFYQCYKDRVSLPTALTIATVPLFATVNGWPTINYHTLGSLGFGASTLLSVQSVALQSNRLALAAGFAFFIAVAGYPSLGATAVFVWLTIAIFRRRQNKPFLRQFLLCAAMATTCTLIFTAYLFFRFEPDDIIQSFHFSRAFNTFGSLYNKIAYSAWLVWGFAPSWWFFFPTLILWLGAWYKYRASLSFLLTPFLIFMLLKPPPEDATYVPAFYILVTLLAAVPILWAILKQGKLYWSECVLWLTIIFSEVIIAWSSGLSMYSSYLVTLYIWPSLLVVSENLMKPVVRMASLCLLIIFLVSVHFKNIPDEDHFFNLTEIFDSGPFAGLVTSQEHHQFLTTLQADINECELRGRSVLFYDHYPAGFLMTDMYPATRSLFMHDIVQSWRVRSMYREFYYRDENRPDCVFRFTKVSTRSGIIYNLDPAQYRPAQDVFWYYLPEETGLYYLLRSRDFYNVYQKKILRQTP